MMDWTDRHCRVFHRLMSRRARLYTEMLTTGAIIHGDRGRLLGFDPSEHPVALQLGGSDPADLATAAKIGEDFGYDEINLNVGCPSDRVKDGRFGACLMAEPVLVADGVAAMKRAVRFPSRSNAGSASTTRIRNRARRAGARWSRPARTRGRACPQGVADGLSPKENRNIPPLDYDRVYRLKRRCPEVPIIINGHRQYRGGGSGTSTSRRRDAGSAAYQEPSRLLEVDPELFGEAAPTPHEGGGRSDVSLHRAPVGAGQGWMSMTRHFVGAFHGVPGAPPSGVNRGEQRQAGAGVDVLRDAIARIEASAALVAT